MGHFTFSLNDIWSDLRAFVYRVFFLSFFHFHGEIEQKGEKFSASRTNF